MVLLPSSSGKYCIDATPVTQQQYQQFLLAKGQDVSGQLGFCKSNASYAQPSPCPSPSMFPMVAFDPSSFGDYAVTCTGWCDAYAFCSWAGKRLCSSEEWDRAFIAGGADANGPVGPCEPPDAGAHWPRSVASMPKCRGATPPWSSVYDMGHPVDWTDEGCFKQDGGPFISQPCASVGWPPGTVDDLRDPLPSIRCCADP
jgi:formylglycine-generating enzyme required for sulfatase activity